VTLATSQVIAVPTPWMILLPGSAEALVEAAVAVQPIGQPAQAPDHPGVQAR
jgi:hypothetical protein